jgi:hypothetical protein
MLHFAMFCLLFVCMCTRMFWPNAVVALSKVRTAFAFSNTGVVGSNPTLGMDVCMRLLCLCIVLCVGSGLAMAVPPSKESYRLCIGLRNRKDGQGPKGCKVRERQYVSFLSLARARFIIGLLAVE